MTREDVRGAREGEGEERVAITEPVPTELLLFRLRSSPLALARHHRLDADEKQIEAEGEVGIQVHALAQGRRGLHETRVTFGWQRLQEESGTPPGVQQLLGFFPGDYPELPADEVGGKSGRTRISPPPPALPLSERCPGLSIYGSSITSTKR